VPRYSLPKLRGSRSNSTLLRDTHAQHIGYSASISAVALMLRRPGRPAQTHELQLSHVDRYKSFNFHQKLSLQPVHPHTLRTNIQPKSKLVNTDARWAPSIRAQFHQQRGAECAAECITFRNTLARRLSAAPLACLMLAHLEWPAAVVAATCRQRREAVAVE